MSEKPRQQAAASGAGTPGSAQGPDRKPDDRKPDESRRDRTGAAPTRSTYRHGDLRRALIEAGIDLARQGGPEAVVLREATRRAGVVPNAAYRHFAGRQDLLQSVRSAALSALAEAMEAEIDKTAAIADPGGQARARLRAVGTGYLRFAFAETGLFRMAFAPLEGVRIAGDAREPADPANAGRSGLNPFQLLGAALDAMVEAGVLPPARRPGAEFLAWSSVHGLAMLVIDGPLRGMPEIQIEAVSQRLIAMVEKGL
ncbi:TetR family transcriptional regulator [Dongia mobilis]|uniref:TetR family transcriptional regulator n=1 Tax=Dongia mobilis TaxID=578943 RepID=A0A4V6PXK0_9PROT|nr:TetR/AcrR family transcriptional regulator [Dongia mobilis]TDQ84061.1 TetR family transcriptional regulator [Dongia mobilis]